MKKPDTTPVGLRKFSLQMTVAFTIVGTLFLLRHKPVFILFYSLGFLFLIGVAAPPFARPLHLFWMKLAFIVEWLVTRLIMAGVFYLVLTPIGFVLRLSGKDLLDRKIDKQTGSYWKKSLKATPDPKNYERQF